MGASTLGSAVCAPQKMIVPGLKFCCRYRLLQLLMKENRPRKNRPSNVLVYVVVGLVGIVVLFILGSFLESRNWGIFQQGAESSSYQPQLPSTQVADGR